MSEVASKILDLGWINGWGKNVPEIVTNCIKAEHTPTETILNDQLTHKRIYCEKCNFEYFVDSSD